MDGPAHDYGAASNLCPLRVSTCRFGKASTVIYSGRSLSRNVHPSLPRTLRRLPGGMVVPSPRWPAGVAPRNNDCGQRPIRSWLARLLHDSLPHSLCRLHNGWLAASGQGFLEKGGCRPQFTNLTRRKHSLACETRTEVPGNQSLQSRDEVLLLKPQFGNCPMWPTSQVMLLPNISFRHPLP